MEKLANILGISPNTLTRNINGNPTIETLEKIASALNVSVQELFHDSGVVGFIKADDEIFEVKSISDIEDLLKKIKK